MTPVNTKTTPLRNHNVVAVIVIPKLRCVVQPTLGWDSHHLHDHTNMKFQDVAQYIEKHHCAF
jgi:hypothetical protein